MVQEFRIFNRRLTTSGSSQGAKAGAGNEAMSKVAGENAKSVRTGVSHLVLSVNHITCLSPTCNALALQKCSSLKLYFNPTGLFVGSECPMIFHWLLCIHTMSIIFFHFVVQVLLEYE